MTLQIHNNGSLHDLLNGGGKQGVHESTHSLGPIRAHLHHLRPKHALFHVRLQIHLLASVPLVSGNFAVKWKFRNAQNVSAGSKQTNKTGLLQKVRHPRSRSRPRSSRGTSDQESRHLVEEDAEEDSSLGSPDSNSASTSAEHGEAPKPAPILSAEHVNMFNPSSRSSSASTMPHKDFLLSDSVASSSTSTSTSTANLSSLPRRDVAQSLQSSSASTVDPSTGSSTDYTPQARGMTAYRPLKEHRATWEQTVDSVVRMDIDRDSKDLLPSYLKLVVMQEIVPGHADAPQNPRFGSLHLNLAEYVGTGPEVDMKVSNGASKVTRRYLLAESKTNATLKLTLCLERIGGESDFVPPPLPKGEIFAGVTALLEDDVYKTRPTALDFFGPQTVDSAAKDLGKPSLFKRGTSVKSPDTAGAPFDISKLTIAAGPQSTETLIEALFNPVPVTDQRKATPFTYYDPPSSKGNLADHRFRTPSMGSGSDSVLEGADRAIPRPRGTEMDSTSSAASVYSFTTDSSVSACTSESHEGSSSSSCAAPSPSTLPRSSTEPANRQSTRTGGIKGLWMKKTSSRPRTPVNPVG